MEQDKDRQRKDVERFIKRIPPLSPTVGKVMAICSRTDASPNELNKVISLDPLLSGQVFKLINSTYYSLVSKVTSLTRAITMLGMNTVKNLALSAAVMSAASGLQKSKALPAGLFWQHSIATGVCAKLFGESAGFSAMEREELFLAGLLHDLGKVPFNDEYLDVVRLVEKEQIPFLEAERALLTSDHEEVGLLIAEKWKLNTALRECIAHHHNIAGIPDLGENAVKVGFVALGDLYANIYDYGFAGNIFPHEEDLVSLMEFTGINLADFTGIGERIEEEIRQAEVFLSV